MVSSRSCPPKKQLLLFIFYLLQFKENKFNMRKIRLVGALFGVLLLTTACGLAELHIDTAMPFNPQSQKAVVIGGVDVAKRTSSSGLTTFFQQYDPETQRLMPDGGSFLLSDTLFSDDLTLKTIDPGHYILIGYLHEPFSRLHLIDSPDKNALGGISGPARVGGIETYRFKIAKGEAVYLGEFVALSRRDRKWVDRSDEVKAQLLKMPNFKAPFIFRPPTLSKE